MADRRFMNTPVRVAAGGPVGRVLPYGPGDRQLTVAWTDDADGLETVHDVTDLLYAPDAPLVYGERVRPPGSEFEGTVAEVVSCPGSPAVMVRWDDRPAVAAGPYWMDTLERAGVIESLCPTC